MSMPARALTSLQLQALLKKRGIAAPAASTPQTELVALCAKHGITEVPLAQLAALHSSVVPPGGKSASSAAASSSSIASATAELLGRKSALSSGTVPTRTGQTNSPRLERCLRPCSDNLVARMQW